MIFRKYEFETQAQAEELIALVPDECKAAVVHLGELTLDKYSVDILWQHCEQCPELLWNYIFIGEQSSHYFLGYDEQSYLPIPLTLVEDINGV